jgi:NAD(P)-dependent dehydrogenase (short-subunit alcohol dehydrogenase family)
MRQLRDRIAVITGAASGIGREVALQLAGKGCHLALVDVQSEALEETAERARAAGVRVSTHLVDVADKALMAALPEAVVAEHGAVHIVVNNAGVSVTGSVEEQSLEDFEWLIGINFWGVVYGCKFFIPYLKREEEAHIVNLSSVFGIVGLPSQASYNMSKFAVRGLSEALHGELADTQVGISCVHPGGIRTNIVRDGRVANESDRAGLIERFERAGSPPEKAAAKIVRGIERNQLRVRIRPETYVVDWMKRLFPTFTHTLIAIISRRTGGIL